uniref:Ribonuclease H-like domain, reverse transcriptase, RNA-dependent DNA polymerase n=1 Tax=Tanacetum cinerariifolium TaxID=118510 RepID=A0A6L2KDT1_TANCI|nr:ribonuclease H-like domain, reverse transcriptase, RNA-dependent DNA polymerase [Tanacetum cinerariifolium]
MAADHGFVNLEELRLVQSIDERHSFIQELERWPRNLKAYKTRYELTGLQKDDLIKAMEMRKIVLQFHLQIHWESFGEEIRQLVRRIDEIKFDHPILNMLLDKVVSDFDMLRLRVLDLLQHKAIALLLSQYIRILLNPRPYRFMQEPREQYMKAIRQVLRYIKGTKDYEITYMHNKGNKIHGFSDTSYGVNTQEGKGATGIIFYYGESPISWSTQKQAIVALSSCESEFIAETAAATQALWLKRLLSKLTHSQEEKVTIKVDNCYSTNEEPRFYGRSKHIDTKYHFIRECVEREDIQVKFVSGKYQRADILTKALPKIKFLTMRQLIGLKDLRHSDCD